MTKPTSKPIKVSENKPDHESSRPLFGWSPTYIIKHTFQLTAQYEMTPMSAILKKHYKSPFPALNSKRRNEPIAMDTVYSDTPAVDNGCKQAYIFVGTKIMFTCVYDMKTDSQFVNTLEYCICDQGAMSQLVSDYAQVKSSKCVLDILRALYIGNW